MVNHIIFILSHIFDRFPKPNTTIYPLLYSWIARQLGIGRTSAFLLSMFDSKSAPSFGFLIENYTGHVFWIFFEKPKNELVRPKMVFLAILAKIRSFFDNSDV